VLADSEFPTEAVPEILGIAKFNGADAPAKPNDLIDPAPLVDSKGIFNSY
jgi:hypothetical protein